MAVKLFINVQEIEDDRVGEEAVILLYGFLFSSKMWQ